MTTHLNPNVVVGRAPQYRLNRRGKLVISLLAVLFVAVIFFVLGAVFSSVVQAAETDNAPAQFSVVVVQPGDSLWSIASTYAPNDDPRELVSILLEVNELESAADLQAGSSLLVPVVS